MTDAVRSVDDATWTCQEGIVRSLEREDGWVVHTGDWFCKSCGDWVCGNCERVHGDDEPMCPFAGSIPVAHAS